MNVMVNGLRNAQIPGKTLLLGVSVRCFWKRLAFDSGDCVKNVGSPHRHGWASSNLLN